MKQALSFAFLLLAAVLLLALAASPVFGGAGGYDKAEEARKKHTGALMANPNVVGVGLGLNPASQGVIRVYTLKQGVKLPDHLDGVPVEAVVTGMVVARGCPPTTNRCDRPVPIGVSTGHPNITAGTIGARVNDPSGNVYALSNNPSTPMRTTPP